MNLWNQMTLMERQAHNDVMAARRKAMKTEALLPCPFCGNKEPARAIEHNFIGPTEGLGSGGYISHDYIVCHGCGARHQAPNPDSLHWNSRI